MRTLSSKVMHDLVEAPPIVKENAREPPRMARLVGLGVGAQSASAQADDRSALQRDRPSTNARTSGHLPRGCRRRPMGHRNATTPRQGVGGYRGTGPGAAIAGR